MASAAFLPAVVVPLVLATHFEDTKEAAFLRTQATVFWARYACEMIIICCILFCNFLNGLASSAEARQENSVRHRLFAQATKAQALLETAVPPPVARALLSGKPAHELTRSFPSATIAFICLTDFEHMVTTLQPHALLHWLDDIYGTFDRLIDLYDESIIKIETVMGTYVVAALPGISADIEDHTIMIAQFCADVLELCASINNQLVNVQIGINCGQVTAGVIGRTRQFFRLFGDTMNGTIHHRVT
jgi:class 3 adenylate cyclase